MTTTISTNLGKEAGVALILSLLLLLVMTVLGVAAMSNVNMQERMAGNANLQTLAFETAAAGVSNSIPFAFEQGDGLECGTWNHPGWPPTEWVEIDMGDGLFLQQRMYCLQNWETPRSQLFVLNRGEVRTGQQTVALRDIEVRLDLGIEDIDPPGICCATQFPGGNTSNVSMSSSGAFTMDGNGGHAACLADEDTKDIFDQAISEQPNGNYLPQPDPFATTPMPEPWDSAENIVSFINQLKHLAQEASGCGPSACWHPNGWNQNNPKFGSANSPQITFLDGDLIAGGNPSGHGIMVVNGNVSWNGNGDFTGLMIVLGDSYEVTGGGTGGVTGSLVMAPIDWNAEPPDFADINITFHTPGGPGAGGGNALYKFDCEVLEDAWEELLHGPEAQAPVPSGEFDENGDPILVDANVWETWDPNCNCGTGNIFDEGPENWIVASWRENIGWREQFVGSN